MALLSDQFTTNASAPLTSPRTCEPGPSTITIVDTENKLSIASSALSCSGGKTSPAHGDPGMYGASQARAAGRAFLASILTNSNNTQIGWHNAGSGRVTFEAFYFGGSLIHQPSDQSVGSYSAATTYTVAFIQRAAGCFLLISGGAFATFPSMTMIWIDAALTTTPLFPAWSNFNSAVTMDDWRVQDLAAPWTTKFGAATSSNATPTTGATGTQEVDAFVEFTWTAATGETLELDVRRTDASNRWCTRCAQGGSTIKLIEINVGVETERASAAMTWTNGTVYRVVVRCIGNTITNYAYANSGNQAAQKNNYASASFNNTATGTAVAGFATGADFAAWPRTITVTEPTDGQPMALRQSFMPKPMGRGF